MSGSCSSIDTQVNRKGGRLVIGWAYDRVYTVIDFTLMRQYLRAVTWPEPKAKALYKRLYIEIQFMKSTKIVQGQISKVGL